MRRLPSAALLNPDHGKEATVIERPRSVDTDDIIRAGQHLHRFGYAKTPFLVPDGVKALVAREALALVDEVGVRRDVSFKETGHTPRRMRNVTRHEIGERGTVIPRLYESQELRDLLGAIAGERVLPCPYLPEQFVITVLERNGDTHGWHWDDYSYALVWVIECPPLEEGGFVQCVPGTTWNKENPQINRALVDNPIYSMELMPGDLYLMRTDTTLHRVHEIRSGRRTIINMAYASAADADKDITHETMDSLWSEGER
ncbi:HalD/BesD family halogenase [Actinomadura sp. ATCC 39365]